VLSTLKAADLGEDRDGGERDNGTDARDRFQSFHRLAPLACTFTETEVKRAGPLGGLAPHGIVMAHMLLDCVATKSPASKLYQCASVRRLPRRPGDGKKQSHSRPHPRRCARAQP